jgi:hypothetical protein
MQEQGMSLAQSLGYGIGGLCILAGSGWMSFRIFSIARADHAFMNSKSDVGSQAVVLNLLLYLAALALLLKGAGLDG